jgi:hypothetical protein
VQRSASWLVSIGLMVSVAGITPPAQSAAPRPVKHGYVVNAITFPTNSDQARALGRDLTRDGEPDNQFGMVLATLATQGFDFNSLIDETIRSGAVVMLHSLRTTSLANAKGATLRVLRGVPKANPDLNGGGLFRVDTTKPSVKLPAGIRNYKVKAGPGAMPVVMPGFAPGAAPVFLTLKKGRINATCRRARCVHGRITGALPMTQINGRLMPAFASQFQTLVNADCPTEDTCGPGSTGATLLNLFDANDDGQITATELRENSLMKSLFAPDVDLVKGGAKEAMSFGVGFTSASARIRGD